jgi:hypothetical protein
MTVKKTGRLVASTGVALALGASLLAATPAVAAPDAQAPTVATAAAGIAATGTAEAAGPAYSDRNVSITTSVIQGDDIVVRGVVEYATQPTLVQAAAGSGYETVAPVAADGSFAISIPRHGHPEYGYVLQFGKPLGATAVFARMKALDTYWYADRA